MRSILIGNGINARLKIEQLHTDKIFDRFVSNAQRYVPLFDSVFSNKITAHQINDLFDKNNKNNGIETQARKLYDYVKNVTQHERNIWSDNNENRLQDIITCIAILSIFYDKNGLINPLIDRSLLPDFSNYEKVFTLNYHEFWDGNGFCIPLHGRIDYNALENKMNAFLYNYKRMSFKEYNDGIEKMKLNSVAVALNSSNYVFAPEGIDKRKLICISGISPSNKLFPAEDLYLIKHKDLYSELNGVTELDIFGVSPYGDEDLIKTIDKMKNVRVFVHEKDTSQETGVWKSKLKNCSYVLEDALLI